MSKVDKFTVRWQITRIQLKQIKDINAKLSYARNFLNSCTQEDKERLLNWIDGLALGYKTKQINTYNLIESFKKEVESRKLKDNNYYESSFTEYDFEIRLALWKDLFKRSEKWAKGGYEHKGQTAFMVSLWNSFSNLDKKKIGSRWDIDSFRKMIDNKPKDMTHNFLY